MKPKQPLDMDKIARGLGAVRMGTVRAGSGPFNAARLVDEVRARFRSPQSGGRQTDPEWSEQRLVKLTPGTLKKLEAIARDVSERGQPVAPLQVAALLLEQAVAAAEAPEVGKLARKRSA